ncbi:MAG: hypothetical protein RMK74_16285 [Myxococcales bacterium]|nr:hypothetical protein [Myxococcales bacterium]
MRHAGRVTPEVTDMKWWMVGWLVCWAMVSGCTSERGGGGSRVRRDGGITIPDSGSTPDTGGGGTDATTPRPDGGGGRDAGGSCPRNDVPPWTGAPGCAASTRTCLSMAMTSADIERCIMMDPNREMCVLCLNQQIISCANGMGCQDEWDCLAACIETCPEGDSGCVDRMCGTQNTAYDGCLMGLPRGSCASAVNACFPS